MRVSSTFRCTMPSPALPIATSSPATEQALLRGSDAPPLTLLLLDLDNFKPINDALGHAAGDAVLLEVATRLRDTTREGDTVARLGGDEFVLVLSGLDNHSEVDRFCARLIDLLQQPILFEDQALHIGASLGIARAAPKATMPGS